MCAVDRTVRAKEVEGEERKEPGQEDRQRGIGAAENGMGPNFEPLPTSELAILLSIFHPSLRQAERAKLQVLLIIECSILICTKGNFSGFLNEPHAVRERE